MPFKVKPLTKPWIRNKVRKKLDPRTFLATGDYVRGIGVRKRTDSKAGVTYVVTMANRKHKVSGIRLQRLGLILEFGTRQYSVPLFGDKNNMVTIKIPSRPHWRPAYQELKKIVANIGQEANAWAMREAIQRLS
jgi:hypothetical protein